MPEFFSESNVSSSRPKDESTESYIQTQVGLGYMIDAHNEGASDAMREAKRIKSSGNDIQIGKDLLHSEYLLDKAVNNQETAEHAEAVRKARQKARIGVQLTPEEETLATEMVPWKNLPEEDEGAAGSAEESAGGDTAV